MFSLHELTASRPPFDPVPAAHDVSLLHVGSQSCGSGLLQAISLGLTQPGVPLSAAAAALLSQQPGAGSSRPHHAAGDLVKSLPVELLYDDRGLQLFDQITTLPEYYLTEAEASILAACGTDIARRCCVQDGTLLLELGAGSMRKTRLLLGALERLGCQDVTFAALDLCQDALTEALTALRGCCGSSIRMVGLVGTYHQGLDYIAALQQQQQQHLRAAQLHAAGSAAAPAGPEGSSDGEDEATVSGADSTTSTFCALRALSGISMGAESCSSGNISSISTDAAIEITAAGEPGPEKGGTTAAGVIGRSQQMLLPVGDAPRVVLWLGSSIGNCSREQAAVFLQQVQQKAMRPGDFLLVGIDRRNDPGMVAAAYNDKTGVTRDFILNGLHHCRRLLDAAAPEGSSAASRGPSLTPEHFEYFCLYNQELGRHEAYYQAQVDTTVHLLGGVATGGGVDGAVVGAVVPVAAGELISVEFSYKYRQEEVEQLAANAGLVRITAWSDAQQRYDLHLLQCRG